MTFAERLEELRKSKGISKKELLESCGFNKNVYSLWLNKGTIPTKASLKILSEYFNVPIDYLSGNSDVPPEKALDEVHPYHLRGMRPVIGVVSAGLGAIAEEDIIGWQRVDDSMDTDDFFWFQISGDSMYPMINDRDMVLVQKDAPVASGNIVVAVVDGSEGFVKRIEFTQNSIILHSYNPLYQDMIFKDNDRNRIHIVGKARKVERDL